MARIQLATAFAIMVLAASPAPATWSMSHGRGTSTSSGGHISPNSSNGGQAGTPVPEPADFALFAAGIIGLIVGRRGSRNRRRD